MQYRKGFTLCFAAAVLFTTVSGSLSSVNAAGEKPISAGHTKIVRAVNLREGNICIPKVIASGNTPPVKEDEELTDLSVSCSDDRAVDYVELEKPLAKDDRGYCLTTLKRLRDKNRSVKIVSNPTDDNPYHCLLSDITPKQFVAAVKEQRQQPSHSRRQQVDPRLPGS